MKQHEILVGKYVGARNSLSIQSAPLRPLHWLQGDQLQSSGRKPAAAQPSCSWHWGWGRFLPWVLLVKHYKQPSKTISTADVGMGFMGLFLTVHPQKG